MTGASCPNDTYEITAGPLVQESFDDLDLPVLGHAGVPSDRAALYDVFRRISDLGLTIIKVQQAPSAVQSAVAPSRCDTLDGWAMTISFPTSCELLRRLVQGS